MPILLPIPTIFFFAGNSDSDSDSDDDTAALMAELQKIKREKAAEEREKEEVKQQEEERIRSAHSFGINLPLKKYHLLPKLTSMFRPIDGAARIFPTSYTPTVSNSCQFSCTSFEGP